MPVSERMTFKIIQSKKEKGKQKMHMQKFMAAKPLISVLQQEV